MYGSNIVGTIDINTVDNYNDLADNADYEQAYRHTINTSSPLVLEEGALNMMSLITTNFNSKNNY